MKKVVNIGSIARHRVFCEIKIEQEEKGLVLSIHGVVGPKPNGDCWGSCGQMYESIAEIDSFAKGWDKKKAERFVAIWKRWHLNDMHPECQHQKGWPFEKVLTVQSYTTGGSDKFRYLEAKRKIMKLGTRQEKDFQETEAAWRATVIGTDDADNIAKCERLVQRGLLRRWKTEEKTAGWVYPSQHPEGLFTKACPVCGYRYGTAWLFEEIPEEIIAELEALPETTVTPAWV